MNVTLERTTLFEEVWKTPLTTLSKKYGLSDNGLRKVCIALSVPLPKAGHWAKQAFGKAVQPPKLPTTTGPTTYQCYRQFDPAAPSTKLPSDTKWLQARQLFEADGKNAVLVTDKPRKWHPAVEPLRTWILECIAAYQAALKKQAQHKKGRRVGKYQIEDHYVDWDVRQHEPILGSTRKSSAMRVSLQTYARALSILNAMAFAAEDRGFKVTLGTHRERVTLDMEHASFGMYITEHLNEAVKTVQNSWNSDTRQERIAVSSGRLRLNVERPGYGVYQINDAEDSPIESNLIKVFLHAYRHVMRQREESRRRDFLQQQEDEKRRLREEIEQKRKEAERLLAEEEQRRSNLVKQAESWHKSMRIRELVDHISANSALNHPNQAFEKWRIWAIGVADGIDPTDSLIKQFTPITDGTA